MSESIPERAHKVVAAIVADFTDRRGLRSAWDRIDDDIRAEIIAEWERIVAKAIDDAAWDVRSSLTDEW